MPCRPSHCRVELATTRGMPYTLTMSSAPRLHWKYHINPRPRYVALDGDGHFEIVDKHWFFSFVPLNRQADHGSGIKWRAAASLEDAQAQCELLSQQMRLPHDQGAFDGSVPLRPQRPLDDDSTLLAKRRKRGAGEPTPPKSHTIG